MAAAKTTAKIAKTTKTTVKKKTKKTPATTAVKVVVKKAAVKKVAKKSSKVAAKKTSVKKTVKKTVAGMTPVKLPSPEAGEKKAKKKEKANAIFAEQVICESTDAARDLYAQSRFGALLDDGKLQLSLIEALYLLEKDKLIIKDTRSRPYDFPRYIKKAKRIEPNFWVRYCVFKDMRNRGYIVKTALKFGADFRVYDRGVKPGEDHARWVLYPIHEGTTLTWHEFAAKARVAHSTKKRLLIGIVDDEGDVTYYEIRWMRP